MIYRYFLPSFGTFGQAVSEENNCLNQPIRNKSRLWQGELKKSFEQHSLKVFELSCEQTWPPQAILVSDWLNSKNLL
jgi:hypothetical protein